MAHDPDSWWLDERNYAGREHFDEKHARRYDAKTDSGGTDEVRLLQDRGLVEAGFLTYAHTGPQADVVYSRFALHHLPDFWQA